jgi:hypothetical protein
VTPNYEAVSNDFARQCSYPRLLRNVLKAILMRAFWLAMVGVVLAGCAGGPDREGGGGDRGDIGDTPPVERGTADSGDADTSPAPSGDAGIADAPSSPTIGLEVLEQSTNTDELVFQVKLHNLGEATPLDARWCNFYLDASGSGAFTSCSNPISVEQPCGGLVTRGGMVVCNVAFRRAAVGALSSSAALMFTDGTRSVTTML